MNINDIFEKIYVISLINAKSRRKYIGKELKQNNIDFEFIDAEEPMGLSLKNKQIVGNRMSHLKAILKAKYHNYKNILVLEDDIIINTNKCNETIQNVWEFMQKNEWCLIYLGGRHQIRPNKISKNIVKPIRVIGTHAVVYNIYNSDDIIRIYSEEKNINTPIDYVLSGDSSYQINDDKKNFITNKKCYACYPLFIYQKTGTNINQKIVNETYWHERF